jgi:flagellar hook-length control protein FliK
VNVPVAPQPDPDAAQMGQIARGESLNAAVSIEHPELGSMDVLVRNENGRIDVRATLETPRAAAVLRAHESALRYGVQQAGMTLGALRVNARTGETKVERSRDVPKRRRERDWEA